MVNVNLNKKYAIGLRLHRPYNPQAFITNAINDKYHLQLGITLGNVLCGRSTMGTWGEVTVTVIRDM